MNKVIKMLTIVTCICAVSATHVSAKTKDGVTPAAESVCDELKGGTPGLFGLCNAYCEARDCDDPLVDCGASGEEILASYDSKRRPGDPDMPCLVEAVSCPCFGEADILELSGPYQLCFVDYRGLLTAIYSGGVSLRVISGASPKCYNGSMLETTQDESAACSSLLTTAMNANGCVTSY